VKAVEAVGAVGAVGAVEAVGAEAGVGGVETAAAVPVVAIGSNTHKRCVVVAVLVAVVPLVAIDDTVDAVIVGFAAHLLAGKSPLNVFLVASL
jgi:hypothetical protein